MLQFILLHSHKRRRSQRIPTFLKIKISKPADLINVITQIRSSKRNTKSNHNNTDCHRPNKCFCEDKVPVANMETKGRDELKKHEECP